MIFEMINIESIDEAVVQAFDCGNPSFNDFLQNKAKPWNAAGECVTYAFADADEVLRKSITRIYGFASLNTLGLLYTDNGQNQYLHCAEIRLFAIAKQLRKRHDQTVMWSDVIFKTLLQHLYFMSTSVIGFKALFLNANHDGRQLYIDNGFTEITDYLAPRTDEKFNIKDCTPLLMMITSDTLYDIFAPCK